MPGKRLVVGHFHLIRWSSVTPEDIEELIKVLSDLRRTQSKLPVHIGIQGDDYREADRAATDTLRKRFPALMTNISTNYIVVLATGLSGTLQRAALRSLVTAGRLGGYEGVDRVCVRSSLQAVFDRERDNLPRARDKLLTQCKEHQLI